MEQKTIVVVKRSELLMNVNRKENGEVQLEGCEGKFLQIVLEALRIQYEIVVSKDMIYYDILPDGNFTGNVGKVQRGEAHLTISYLPRQEIRSKDVDFSMPYTLDELTFLTPKPGNIKSNLALLQVFDTTTWISICFVLIVMSVLFAKFKGSVGNNLFKLLGTVVGQSSNIGNGSLSSKMLLTAWFLFTLVISLCYSVTLLSRIIQPTKVAPIRTFHELSRAVQSGDHKLFAMETQMPYLLDSPEDFLKALGRMVVRRNWVISAKKYFSFGIPKYSQVRTKKYALLRYGHHENVYISEDKICVFPIAFAYNKNFCCVSKLNSILSKLWGSGLHPKFWEDASFKMFLKTKRINSECSVISSLFVSDFFGVFMFLCLGWIVSFIVFILEIIMAEKVFCKFCCPM
ncbi:glutamate receptor ionotropic, delta-1 [Caerostris extrusa]|uniref:Glutamate receptor ionotropic, delta-1 n=1 Tax=Caerostris extrusa TaxID=172846 RepID=A0AAV4X818_CAEEX|nr:glutamate receptor ionotropic, delta-1 [Caerostris extrusa]